MAKVSWRVIKCQFQGQSFEASVPEKGQFKGQGKFHGEFCSKINDTFSYWNLICQGQFQGQNERGDCVPATLGALDILQLWPP